MSRRGRRRNVEDDDNGWEKWGGYMNAKIRKLQDQYEDEVENLGGQVRLSSIFKGVAIFVNGYTIPTSDELKDLMVLHGGVYNHYYDRRRTTHIIATSLAHTKINDHVTKKVVTPNWITDSITARKLLPYQSYELYSPTSRKQNVLPFTITRDETESSNDRNGGDSNLKFNPNELPKTDQIQSSKYPPTMCATDSRFLSEFYSHSRLHHISTMGAELKRYVSQLRNKNNGWFPGYQRISEWKINREQDLETIVENHHGEGCTIMHIDMDCFFVSVGLRKRPDLANKPVAVAHSRGIGSTNSKNGAVRSIEKQYYREKRMINSKHKLPNATVTKDGDEQADKYWESEPDNDDEFMSASEIASCSYEARKCGVHNGMFLGEAKKLCPDLQLITYDFDGYREVSYLLYDTVASYTLDIEAVSCDELYADCTEVLKTNDIAPIEFAQILRQEIKEKTGCCCSTGLASNRLLARLATRKAKPNGQFHLTKDEVQDFISGQSVINIPGVGWSLSSRLNAMGVENCLDLQKVSLSTLQNEFGPKTGITLHKMCRGIDDRNIQMDHQRKSVSAEVNYGIRFTKEAEANKFLAELSEEVSKRLLEVGMGGKTVTLKLKVKKKGAPAESSKFMGHGICDSISRSGTLFSATDDSQVIQREAQTLLQAMHVPVSELRGIGLQVQRLEPISTTNGNLTSRDDLLKYLCKKKPAESYSRQPSATSSLSKDPFSPSKAGNSRDVFLPPPSEVDPEFLAAMPDNIKKQIYQEYAERGMNLEQTNSLPGISAQQKRQEEHSEQSRVPSISQVDPSFLQALPPEIQRELEELLKKNENSGLFDDKVVPKVDACLKPMKSPPKTTSRRGRGKGKIINGSPRRGVQRSMQAYATTPTKVKASPKEIVVEAKLVSCDDTKLKEPTTQTALCGATELSAVKNLITEWVKCCTDPQADDIEIICSYLRNVINDKNLERVYIVLKSLYRLVIQNGTSQWYIAWKSIEDEVQSVIVSIYGAPLKL